jgi:peptidyl-prolyl cis-trans isomerase A (cyclophilin A)
VIPEFMIQGGDSLGDGSGEVGYVIPDEVYPGARHDRAGHLCMANRGTNTNGGQFFITDGSSPHLDGGYTIFGRCDNTDVVSIIARVPQGPSNRPLTDVTIEAVTITRDPGSAERRR